MKFSLRLLYLYLFSFVGLIITVIGGIQLIDLGIKTYVFKVSEYTYYPETGVTKDGQQIVSTVSNEEMEKRNKEEQSNQRKRTLSNSLAMIMVGTPLYLYHWKTIKKENKKVID